MSISEINTSADSSAVAEAPRKWLVLLTVGISGFLTILDFSMVNISFPVLTKAFRTEASIVL
ncbi:MAG: hypothetical protein WBN40_09160, partial [Pseudomonadales bacterium]